MARKKNTVRADGRIAVQIYLGRDENGKRKYKTVYGATQKEADAKAEAVKAKIGKGLDILSQQDTFGAWRKLWWTVKQPQIGSGTQTMYRAAQKRMGPLDGMGISKIKTADIDVLLISAAEEGLSHRSLSILRMTIGQIFDYAIDNRVVDYNPADRAKVPAGSGKQVRRALTDEEQTMIRSLPHRAQTAAMIMMYAGLRRGELLALTWDDIDLDASTITVNKTLEFVSGKPQIKNSPKTEAGNRVVTIPEILAEYLRNVPHKAPIICPNASGKYMSTTAWSRLWQSYIVDLNVTYGAAAGMSKHNPHGIPISIDFTAHCLRHTYATLLYKAGVDVLTAQYLLGHADVQTTLGIYTHLDAELKQRGLDKLNDYLSDRIKD